MKLFNNINVTVLNMYNGNSTVTKDLQKKSQAFKNITLKLFQRSQSSICNHHILQK